MLNANVFFHNMVCFSSVSQQLNNFDNNIRKIIYDIGNYRKQIIHDIENYHATWYK